MKKKHCPKYAKDLYHRRKKKACNSAKFKYLYQSSMTSPDNQCDD